MGNTDSIPVISQVKSLVQVISGDEEGAKKTQENFAKTTPIVSQTYSAVLAAEVSCHAIIVCILKTNYKFKSGER